MSQNGRTRPGRGRQGGGRPRRRSAGNPDKGPKQPLEELKPIADPPPIESFDEWPLDPQVLRAIRGMEITTPTPVQKLAIGPVLEGRDVIAKAETGTGKTLAFGAPMVSKLDPTRSTILGLVLCPTRELAQQVEQVLKALGLPKGLKTALLVGGDPIPPQIKQLQQGAQLVVATPGRVLDLVGQRFLSFPWTEFAVLDEADEMLEIGFLDDVNKILGLLPEERQTLLFSATFPPALLQLARSHTKNPVEVATAKGVATVDRITQHVCEVSDDDKPHVLKRLLRASSPDDLFLVFCDRRTEVDRVFRFLDRLPVQVKALHGGYDQASRFRVMSAFRSGDVRALVATDVASRGLDVSGVTHVINYSPPRDISDYTHRIGRTGRAGATGHALTFVGGADRRKWRELEGRMTWDVPSVDERDLARVLLGGGDSSDGDGRRSRDRDGDRDGRRDGDRPRRRRDEDDERPRRRRERSEERPAEERRSGRDDENDRPRRRRPAAEDSEPRREDRERGERRPRRRERDRDEDRPRSRRREQDERSEEAPRDREPRRSRTERADERDERPRRRSRRDGEGRAERGRGGRDREGRPSGGRPRASAPSDSTTSGFGAGLEPDRAPRKRPERRAQPERQTERESPPSRSETPSDAGGFGAGIPD
jgi:superfamily II DNA/RNA helicase